jgi:hypothetical protein
MGGNLVGQTADSRRAELDVLRPSLPQPDGPVNSRICLLYRFRPATMRRVSVTRVCIASAGWQRVKISRGRSSPIASAGPGGSSLRPASVRVSAVVPPPVAPCVRVLLRWAGGCCGR